MIIKRKLGPKGQVLLPKSIREYLGIKPGDEITIEIDNSEVKIRSAIDSNQYLPKLYEVPHKLKEKVNIEAIIEDEYQKE